MKFLFKTLFSFLQQKFKTIVAISVSLGIFALMLFLYNTPLEAIIYAAILSLSFILAVTIWSFISFYKKHVMLLKLQESVDIPNLIMPVPSSTIEADYQQLVDLIDKSRTGIITNKDKAYTEMLDYYTVWVHQIKTPIAAMQFVLQSKETESNIELLDQLFKIEQYVEMVLQYLRMESMSGDIMFKSYSLDSIIKQAVRKYSKSFIHKRIKLNYSDVNTQIITDEKWLVFVIEQLLSNALKYTNEGTIHIYMENVSLIIQDTGIGIEQEDLPRIFEKGFTGYNGRSNKKSTGIGLYLCKRILNNLSHTISAEAIVGKGSRFKIGFDTVNVVVE